ncbi:hypothetical protein ES705_43144 [subsurface metagenome]
MNLIKWLSVGKDLKLGKLKMEIKEKDVIVVKDLYGHMDHDKSKNFARGLLKMFPKNNIIFLSIGVSLAKLDEGEMRNAGWFRK